ncbi:MAG: hypothetical protein LBL52_02610, partial [Rickettsiales bacterium]|nr:hypothetical protein [Rickettsiales bacterium]
MKKLFALLLAFTLTAAFDTSAAPKKEKPKSARAAGNSKAKKEPKSARAAGTSKSKSARAAGTSKTKSARAAGTS